MKCMNCKSDNLEIIARGTESILYECKSCKAKFISVVLPSHTKDVVKGGK
jgi:uncharacterized Zn finger protein